MVGRTSSTNSSTSNQDIPKSLVMQVLTASRSMSSHKRLWNMTKSEGQGGQNYSQDCSICLNSIAVCLTVYNRLPGLEQPTNKPCRSLVNVSSSLPAHTHGTSNASVPSCRVRTTRSLFVLIVEQRLTSRPRWRTQKTGKS